MEPVTTIAGVLGVTTRLVMTLNTFIQSISDAPAYMQDVFQETRAVEFALQELKRAFAPGVLTEPPTPQWIASLNGTMERCKICVSELSGIVEPLIKGASSSYMGRKWTSLKWVIKESDVLRLERRMQSQKATMVILLNALSLSTGARIERVFREYDLRNSEAMNFVQADIIARESDRVEKGEKSSIEQFNRPSFSTPRAPRTTRPAAQTSTSSDRLFPSLKQSQSESGSAYLSPKALNFSSEEKTLYQRLFREVGSDNLGVVTGGKCVRFFEKSLLSPLVLGQIWHIVDEENRGVLTPAEFSLMLRLIGHCQAGRVPSEDLAYRPGPLPKFEGPKTHSQPSNSPTPSRQAAGSSWEPLLLLDEAAEYPEHLGHSGGQDLILPAEAAKNIFQNPPLTDEVQNWIWGPADPPEPATAPGATSTGMSAAVVGVVGMTAGAAGGAAIVHLASPISEGGTPVPVPEDHAVTDTTSLHSSHSLAVLAHHPDLHNPGLSASLVESVSTWFADGAVTKSLVVGEIALAHNATTSSAESENIRLSNFHILEKVATNPTFVHATTSVRGKERATEDSAGEYTVNLSAIRKPTPTVAVKYLIHLEPENLASYSPILLTPAWQCQESQASMTLLYGPNPAFIGAAALQDLALKNVVISVSLDTSEGVWAERAMMQPTVDASFNRKIGMVVWRMPELKVVGAQKKQLVRFITSSGVPKRGIVEAKWEYDGLDGNGSQLLGVQRWVEADTEADLFTDDNSDHHLAKPATGKKSWVDLDTRRKLVSGRYIAQ